MSRKPGTTTITMSVREYVDVDAEVDVDKLEDSELLACVKEARKRGLLGVAGPDERASLAIALHDLMSKRVSHAISAIETALFPNREDLLAAWDAAKSGRVNDAILYLDKVVNPAPVPTKLPERPACATPCT